MQKNKLYFRAFILNKNKYPIKGIFLLYIKSVFLASELQKFITRNTINVKIKNENVKATI